MCTAQLRRIFIDSDGLLDNGGTFSGAGAGAGATNANNLTLDVIIYQTSGSYCLVVHVSEQCT